MAKLEKCPACEKSLSIEAEACPHCGHPLDKGWGEKAGTERKTNTRNVWLLSFVWIFVIWFWLDSDDPSSSITVSSSEYGADWGFTVSTLKLKCGSEALRHVIVEANGIEYGLNGSAMGSDRYRSARKIMAKDKNGLFTFDGPRDLILRGLRMCDGNSGELMG